MQKKKEKEPEENRTNGEEREITILKTRSNKT
jgi:hypothetical protein